LFDLPPEVLAQTKAAPIGEEEMGKTIRNWKSWKEFAEMGEIHGIKTRG